ncbi:MAG: FAD-dependent oxidoreductase [bacterium]
MELPGFSLDMASLTESPRPETGETYDVLILGGGPAAMSAAVYAARKLLKTAVLTKDFGGQMLETSEVENWLGIQSIHARDLVSQFEDHVKSFDVPILEGTSITGIKKQDDLFKVSMDNGETYTGRTVILTTGKRHRHLGVPGEKEFAGKGVVYCATCDAPFFRDKKVVIAGGGNSAFTTALDLLKANAAVTLVNFIKGWQADGFIQEQLEKYEHVSFYDNHELKEIRGSEKVEAATIKNRETGEERDLEAQGVFVEIGLSPNSELVKDLVETNEAGEIVVGCACETSLDGFFAAGDVTTVPHKQIIISAGEGAKAALSAYSYLVRKFQL